MADGASFLLTPGPDWWLGEWGRLAWATFPQPGAWVGPQAGLGTGGWDCGEMGSSLPSDASSSVCEFSFPSLPVFWGTTAGGSIGR